MYKKLWLSIAMTAIGAGLLVGASMASPAAPAKASSSEVTRGGTLRVGGALVQDAEGCGRFEVADGLEQRGADMLQAGTDKFRIGHVTADRQGGTDRRGVADDLTGGSKERVREVAPGPGMDADGEVQAGNAAGAGRVHVSPR